MPVPGTTLSSLRPLTRGTNAVVVASHPAAAMAGYEVLRRGGNAVDAGVPSVWRPTFCIRTSAVSWVWRPC
jgi:gamma-glutamyltranspeptidase